ncbi:MAG: MgtC/SapB family protein [Bacteroidota bacterium]|nr:MgtC/SapB family protein [Bacteroidota bacterium]
MTWSFILRIIVAGLLGGLIGLEREIRAKEAGLRTHFIVALGSALFMIISQYAFTGRFDAARVAAQVVSGIGFIGAGVIIFQKNVVRGVTTAAGLWVAAAIGLACGAGMYPVATAAAALTVICLEAMHIITNRYGERLLTVKVTPADNEKLLILLDSLKKAGMDIESFSLSEGEAIIQIRMKHKDYMGTVRSVLTFAKGLSVDII